MFERQKNLELSTFGARILGKLAPFQQAKSSKICVGLTPPAA
jgi:hypothetical protein